MNKLYKKLTEKKSRHGRCTDWIRENRRRRSAGQPGYVGCAHVKAKYKTLSDIPAAELDRVAALMREGKHKEANEEYNALIDQTRDKKVFEVHHLGIKIAEKAKT